MPSVWKRNDSSSLTAAACVCLAPLQGGEVLPERMTDIKKHIGVESDFRSLLGHRLKSSVGI